MKINWKLRLKNKYTLMALIAVCVGFVFTALGLLGIVPSISEERVIELFALLLDALVAIGVIVDPTTQGMNDSAQAMDYDNPKVEAEDEILIDSEYKGGDE